MTSETLHTFLMIYKFLPKAPSILATMSKQHCRTLQVERFFRQCRMLLKHCCRFRQQCCRFRQQCRTIFRSFDMSKQIEHVQFVSTLSKGRNFTIELFDIVAVCGNKVECCFDNVACCFDIVAGVDGA